MLIVKKSMKKNSTAECDECYIDQQARFLNEGIIKKTI